MNFHVIKLPNFKHGARLWSLQCHFLVLKSGPPFLTVVVRGRFQTSIANSVSKPVLNIGFV